MNFKKDDIYGLLGTLAFHLVIFLILWFTVLKTVVPEEDEGILVNFGNLNAATGTFEPRYTGEIIPQSQTPPPPSSPSTEIQQEELVTQDIEESISLENAKREEERRRQEEAERERLRREETERQRLAEAQERANTLMAGAFGRGNTDSTSQGDSVVQGKGTQGSPFRDSDLGRNKGTGGNGSTYDLGGRGVSGRLQEPKDNGQIAGKIVIEIRVNTNGDVYPIAIGKGTTIENKLMRDEAFEAARRTKFERGTKDDFGTITYNYILK